MYYDRERRRVGRESDQWGTVVPFHRLCPGKPHVSRDLNKGRAKQAMRTHHGKAVQAEGTRANALRRSVLGTFKATKSPVWLEQSEPGGG